MALVKATLQEELLTIFNTENSAEQAAEKIATAVDNYIKTASVVGTCPAGAVTGTLQ